MIAHRTINVALTAVCATLAAGCMTTRSEQDFYDARKAYLACAQERGEANCQAELNVMNANAAIYGTASHKPVPATTFSTTNATLGVYRAN
jgi:hypothetical protein